MDGERGWMVERVLKSQTENAEDERIAGEMVDGQGGLKYQIENAREELMRKGGWRWES